MILKMAGPQLHTRSLCFLAQDSHLSNTHLLIFLPNDGLFLKMFLRPSERLTPVTMSWSHTKPKVLFPLMFSSMFSSQAVPTAISALTEVAAHAGA